MNRFGAILAFLGCFMTTSLGATLVDDLYEVTLPCQSQSEKERQTLFKEGMRQVLSRVSVEPEPERYPKVAAALEKPVDYVEWYRYDGNQLTLHFSMSAIKPLIQQTGQSTWGQHRPVVVVWLVIEENQQRRFIGQETDPALQNTLRQIAQSHGIPIVLPLMDIEDINALSTGDVWGHYPSVIKDASKRYGAQAILVGRIQHQQEGQWQASWQWITDNDPLMWEKEGNTLDTILADGFLRVTNQLKDNYSVKDPQQIVSAEQSKPLLLGVSNIRNAADFSQLESYLESLDQIHQVTLVQVLGDRTIFEILPRANQTKSTLLQAIGLDKHLLEQGFDPHLTEVDLTFRWVPLGEISG